MILAFVPVRASLLQDMPVGTAADDLSVVPEFWLFVAAGVMTVALTIGIGIFWWRISKDHDRETR